MQGTRSVFIAALVLVAGLVVPTKAADAAEIDGRCDPGEWCLYKDSGFRGCMVDISYDAQQPTGGNLHGDYVGCKGQKVRDTVSSYQNPSKGWLVMWEHPDAKGFAYCVVPGGSGEVLKNFNDKASHAASFHPQDFADQVGGEGKCNHIDRD